jgi:hypothetical protein
MLKKDDEKYLIRLLGRNQVVLFLGAGFSLGAKNKTGEPFPTGNTLSAKLWEFLGLEGDYDDSSLPILFEAFLSAGVKRQRKLEFLESNLLSGEIPEFYDHLATPFWYKIYTTNIDDVVEKVYKRRSKKLRVLTVRLQVKLN